MASVIQIIYIFTQKQVHAKIHTDNRYIVI